jgi:hypothetical protein
MQSQVNYLTPVKHSDGSITMENRYQIVDVYVLPNGRLTPFQDVIDTNTNTVIWKSGEER